MTAVSLYVPNQGSDQSYAAGDFHGVKLLRIANAASSTQGELVSCTVASFERHLLVLSAGDRGFSIVDNHVGDAVDVGRAVLTQQYAELFYALTEMHELDDDDSAAIDDDAYRSAASVLSLLSYKNVEPPRVFSHGGDAVVFSWQQNDRSLYLTVSDGMASLRARSGAQASELLCQVDMTQSSVERMMKFLRVHGDGSGTNSY